MQHHRRAYYAASSQSILCSIIAEHATQLSLLTTRDEWQSAIVAFNATIVNWAAKFDQCIAPMLSVLPLSSSVPLTKVLVELWLLRAHCGMELLESKALGPRAARKHCTALHSSQQVQPQPQVTHCTAHHTHSPLFPGAEGSNPGKPCGGARTPCLQGDSL